MPRSQGAFLGQASPLGGHQKRGLQREMPGIQRSEMQTQALGIVQTNKKMLKTTPPKVFILDVCSLLKNCYNLSIPLRNSRKTQTFFTSPRLQIVGRRLPVRYQHLHLWNVKERPVSCLGLPEILRLAMAIYTSLFPVLEKRKKQQKHTDT